MNAEIVLRSTFYLLALINPASKVFLLSSMDPPYAWRDLRNVSVRSTWVAFLILSVLAVIGNVMLEYVFQIHIYSLRIAGGVVIFLVGLNAVRNGRFFEEAALGRVSDISVVPLAAPLIAGPGTMTAALSYTTIHGATTTVLCLALALIANLLIMLTSLHVGKALEKVNATGPIIRITGLIVAAVAVQMMLNGLAEWQVAVGGGS
ncbi:MAG: MarC family protein [Kiritimatiellae bacterium]|nr:MarC family protein [Kiritimatiellia bacterium]